MKRFLLLVLVIIFVFSFATSAANDVDLDVGEDFLVFDTNPEKVAAILGIESSELIQKINDNGTLFLAVNESNTKQIQLSSYTNVFSKKIPNLSNISDEDILSLLPAMTGINDVAGKIIYLNSQKFVKVALKSESENDSYILTEYFTIADNRVYSLTFYTAPGEKTEYIEDVFNTLSSQHFLNDSSKQTRSIRNVVIIATALISVISLVLVYSIIKDMIFNIKRKQNVN